MQLWSEDVTIGIQLYLKQPEDKIGIEEICKLLSFLPAFL
jgi:hypothetical protein